MINVKHVTFKLTGEVDKILCICGRSENLPIAYKKAQRVEMIKWFYTFHQFCKKS
jgi:hypothetical protein